MGHFMFNQYMHLLLPCNTRIITIIIGAVSDNRAIVHIFLLTLNQLLLASPYLYIYIQVNSLVEYCMLNGIVRLLSIDCIPPIVRAFQ